jgi:hypothetical protein
MIDATLKALPTSLTRNEALLRAMHIAPLLQTDGTEHNGEVEAAKFASLVPVASDHLDIRPEAAFNGSSERPTTTDEIECMKMLKSGRRLRLPQAESQGSWNDSVAFAFVMF